MVSRVLRIVGDKCYQLFVTEVPGLFRIAQCSRCHGVVRRYRSEGQVGGDITLLGYHTILIGKATLVDVCCLKWEGQIWAVWIVVHLGGILKVGDAFVRSWDSRRLVR